MAAEPLTSIFVIAIHVTTMFGHSHYVEPDEERYQGYYTSLADCRKVPKPSLSEVRRKAGSLVEVKAIVCREHKPGKVK